MNGAIQANDGSITSPAYTFSSDSNTGIYRSATDNVAIACGGKLRGVFATNGNVFRIAGDTHCYMSFYPTWNGGDDGRKAYLGFPNSGSTDFSMFNEAGGHIIFGPGDSEKVRFKSNGYVGIGTNNPLTSLSITPSSTGSKITLYDGGDSTNHYGFGISSAQLNYDVYQYKTLHTYFMQVVKMVPELS
jgi:hypothetical protein